MTTIKVSDDGFPYRVDQEAKPLTIIYTGHRIEIPWSMLTMLFINLKDMSTLDVKAHRQEALSVIDACGSEFAANPESEQRGMKDLVPIFLALLLVIDAMAKHKGCLGEGQVMYPIGELEYEYRNEGGRV